jgi:hypothetical protein
MLKSGTSLDNQTGYCKKVFSVASFIKFKADKSCIFPKYDKLDNDRPTRVLFCFKCEFEKKV